MRTESPEDPYRMIKSQRLMSQPDVQMQNIYITLESNPLKLREEMYARGMLYKVALKYGYNLIRVHATPEPLLKLAHFGHIGITPICVTSTKVNARLKKLGLGKGSYDPYITAFNAMRIHALCSDDKHRILLKDL